MTRGPCQRSVQRGFGAVAAIVVVVLLAGLAAAVMRLGSAQQAGAALQLDSVRATQAAQAGVEWGLYQALRNGSCTGSTTLDLSSDLGMRVTVGCSVNNYNEGQDSGGAAQVRRVYTIDAVACNASACPDASRAVTAYYVERRRQVHAVN